MLDFEVQDTVLFLIDLFSVDTTDQIYEHVLVREYDIKHGENRTNCFELTPVFPKRKNAGLPS